MVRLVNVLRRELEEGRGWTESRRLGKKEKACEHHNEGNSLCSRRLHEAVKVTQMTIIKPTYLRFANCAAVAFC